MKPLEQALRFLEQNLAVLPVAHMGKAPTDPRTGKKITGWDKLVITAETAHEYFNGIPQNIGIKLGAPSQWLADVDLDCPEAIEAAPHILPVSRTFGRASAPMAHWVFYAKGAATRQFKDPLIKGEAKATIAELRSTGCQTVFPQSTHESGEPIEWTDEGVKVERVEAATLLDLVGRVAAAALFRRYFPKGWEEEATLALAGGLLASGWSDDDVQTFARAVHGGADLAAAREGRGWERLYELVEEKQRAAFTAARAWIGLPIASSYDGPSIFATPDDEPPELARIPLSLRRLRAQRWLARVAPTTGGDGSSQLISVAATLLRGFALGEAIGFELLSASQLAADWRPAQIHRRCEDAMRGPRSGTPMAWGCKLLEGVAPDDADSEWEGHIVYESGRPKGCVANVMTVMSLHPEWTGSLAYDEFRVAPVLLRDPPRREHDALPVRTTDEWTEQDSTRAAAWLLSKLELDVSQGAVTESMLAVAQQRVVHPVRVYLDGLKWDGVPRLERFFTTYCGSPDNAYTQGVARMFFLSAIARVRRPGCKVDTIVTLEGNQGVLKSTLLRTLTGAEWFSDTPLDLSNIKDAYQSLVGVWIYELAELAAVKGRDATKIKAFASSPSDRYRPSYEKRARPVLRQTIFIGTTNEKEYLTDPTGARRFWPVVVILVRLAEIARDRDQLWAEADVLFKSGAPWWPTRELDRLGAEAQEERYEDDPWEEPIRRWLERPVRVRIIEDGPGRFRRDEERLDVEEGFTMEDVLSGAIELPKRQHGKHEQQRVTAVLHRAGYVRSRNPVRVNGHRTRRWFKGGADTGAGTGAGTGAA